VDEKRENTVLFRYQGCMKKEYLVENRNHSEGCKRINVPIIHKTILTYGQAKLGFRAVEVWENSLPEFLKLAYLPSLESSFAHFCQRNKQGITRNSIKEYVIS
jgi:nicotinamide-nucleotide amidase